MEYLLNTWYKKATSIQRELEKIVKKYEGIEDANVTHLIQCDEDKYIIFVDSKYDLEWCSGLNK